MGYMKQVGVGLYTLWTQGKMVGEGGRQSSRLCLFAMVPLRQPSASVRTWKIQPTRDCFLIYKIQVMIIPLSVYRED